MLEQPIRDRRAERHEATRAEILDAAWAIAREEGLGAVALREVARRVGMQAPSLYSYFASKNDIYDAMFGQAWTECLEVMSAHHKCLPAEPRAALRYSAHAWFDFAVADVARHQLMNRLTIPGFVPSPEAYAPSVQCLELGRRLLVDAGISDPDALDLWTGLTGGLVDQQIANDPGGTRWKRIVDRAVDMYADAMGVPVDVKARRGKQA